MTLVDAIAALATRIGTEIKNRTSPATTSAPGIIELATSAEATGFIDSSRAITPQTLGDALYKFRGPSAYLGVQTWTVTNPTPSDTDVGILVLLSNASPITLALPSYSAEPINMGDHMDFVQWGAGAVTFVAGSGANVYGTPSLVTRAQYSVVSAIKVGLNDWLVVGDLA